MTSPELEYVALFNSSEESSLYEIPAELGRFLPDSPELVTLGPNAVLTLLQKGLVCLYDDAHDSDPLDRARAEAIIASESAWQAPRGSVGDVYLAMTDAGVNALRKYPGLTRKRQHDLIEALLYGLYQAGYPYGLLERFVNLVSCERHPVLRKYQTPSAWTVHGKMPQDFSQWLGQMRTQSLAKIAVSQVDRWSIYAIA